MRLFFTQPVHDTLKGLEQIVGPRGGLGSLAVMVVGLIVTWFIYVPIHELLHVLGCILGGGSVSELQIAPEYGAALLKKVFPFVVSGGDYAGRLSGFNTHGSDLCYLLTDALPFVLTIVIGVPLLKWCTTGKRPVAFGAAVVIGLAPFYNLIGDYYEMGSIITTRALTMIRSGSTIAFEKLRSDDIIRLCGTLYSRPIELGLNNGGEIAAAIGIVLTSFAVAIFLAFVTYGLGSCFAMLFGFGKSGLPSQRPEAN